jgi:hypothetical protein
VVYFPFDSCLPDELSNRLGCKKILKGPLQNRVKTAILRGEVSQGKTAAVTTDILLSTRDYIRMSNDNEYERHITSVANDVELCE